LNEPTHLVLAKNQHIWFNGEPSLNPFKNQKIPAQRTKSLGFSLNQFWFFQEPSLMVFQRTSLGSSKNQFRFFKEPV